MKRKEILKSDLRGLFKNRPFLVRAFCVFVLLLTPISLPIFCILHTIFDRAITDFFKEMWHGITFKVLENEQA